MLDLTRHRYANVHSAKAAGYTRLLLGFALLLMTEGSLGAYITDKLLAGYYASPDLTTEPIRALPNSTPMEVLETKGKLSRVRLGDSSEGWVETRYITQEKPVKTMLLELQAKYASLKRRIDNGDIAKETKTEPTAPSNPKGELRDQLMQAREHIQQLRKSQGEQPSAAENNTMAKQLRQENTLLKQRLEQRSETFQFWTLPLAMLAMLLSFISGIAFKNYRIVSRARQVNQTE